MPYLQALDSPFSINNFLGTSIEGGFRPDIYVQFWLREAGHYNFPVAVNLLLDTTWDEYQVSLFFSP